MSTLVEITGDIKAISDLLDGLVDDDGNPRQPTEDEQKQIQEWLGDSKDAFESKFDSICRYYKNLRMDADAAEGEYQAFKKNFLDGFSQKKKASLNKAEQMKNLLYWNMDRLKMQKWQTALFNAYTKSTGAHVHALAGADLSKIPDKYLKPRELNTDAVMQDIKDGILKYDSDPQSITRGKIYKTKDGTKLDGISCLEGSTLIIK